MTTAHHPPRVLVVTPEVTAVPRGMAPALRAISARAGGLGDVCAAVLRSLFEAGVDVHLCIPDYRNVFNSNTGHAPAADFPRRLPALPERCVHLAQDRSFYYHPKLIRTVNRESIRIALAFQREVINRIIPEVQPDVIHCFDWMTGIVPPMARHCHIPCLFTVYRFDSPVLLLSAIEECGIDAGSFWRHCFYSRMPINYEETRGTNPLDMLASGVFAARLVHTLSPTFCDMMTDGNCDCAAGWLKAILQRKRRDGALHTVAPVPDRSFDPETDQALARNYGAGNHHTAKRFNKLHLQESLSLSLDTTAPLCFWPTRLDGSRAGCRLIIDALAVVLERYRRQGLQLVFMADGDCQAQLRRRIDRLNARARVAVCEFDSRRCRLAYGAADFVLMPLFRDPCALPCKIGQRYGALPIAFDSAAAHDCVEHLNVAAGCGSGFLFRHFDATGLFWALDQAMAFFDQPFAVRVTQVRRIMRESARRFDPGETAGRTTALYARALDRSQAVFAAAGDVSPTVRIAA